MVNGSTLARNSRDVGSSPALGTVSPIFVTPATNSVFLENLCCLSRISLNNLVFNHRMTVDRYKARADTFTNSMDL